MSKENAIFISSNNIQLLSGASDQDDVIRIDEFQLFPFEEGAMINGVITDEGVLGSVLKTISDKGIKDTRLVIDSGQILVKTVRVPLLKQKELQQIIRDELSDVDSNSEDLIYDYSVVHPSFPDVEEKGGDILACAMERKLLGSYIELFENNGIRIKSVDISLNAILKLTDELPDLRGKTYILSILDNNNVYSYLFENNEYTFSNRIRLFSQRGSKEFVNDISSNISSLIQFSKTKHSPYQVDTVYFCGLEDIEKEDLFTNIKESLQIEASEFPNSRVIYIPDKIKAAQFRLHEYVISLGCLIRK